MELCGQGRVHRAVHIPSEVDVPGSEPLGDLGHLLSLLPPEAQSSALRDVTVDARDFDVFERGQLLQGICIDLDPEAGELGPRQPEIDPDAHLDVQAHEVGVGIQVSELRQVLHVHDAPVGGQLHLAHDIPDDAVVDDFAVIHERAGVGQLHGRNDLRIAALLVDHTEDIFGVVGLVGVSQDEPVEPAEEGPVHGVDVILEDFLADDVKRRERNPTS